MLKERHEYRYRTRWGIREEREISEKKERERERGMGQLRKIMKGILKSLGNVTSGQNSYSIYVEE